MPSRDDLRLGLDPDNLFGLWLHLPSEWRQVTLAGCSGAETSPFSLPIQAPVGLRVFYAGLAARNGVASAVSRTRSFVTR